MKIELEQGVWLADGEGDPPRTVLEDHAREFKTMKEAVKALIAARKYKPFECAQIFIVPGIRIGWGKIPAEPGPIYPVKGHQEGRKRL